MPDANETGYGEDDIYPTQQIISHLGTVGQWERLLQMSYERLAQRPEDETAHRGAALACLRMRRSAEAEVHVRTLLRLDPEYAFHLQLAGELAIQTGDFRAAKKHLETGLAVDPERTHLHRLLAVVLSSLGDQKGGREHQEKAQELDGDIKETWLTLEAVLESQGRDAATCRRRIEALQMALAHQPEFHYVQWRVGRLLLRLEQPKAAKVWLQRALVHDPLHPIYQQDWKEACEKHNLIYRCLSYPWRSGRLLRHSKAIIRILWARPRTLLVQLLLFPFWGVILLWWLASWLLLVPVGFVVRYYLQIHPAFDKPGLSRRWLYGRSLRQRKWLMGGTLCLAGIILYLVLPQWPLFWWVVLMMSQLSFQIYVTDVFINQRKAEGVMIPPAWLLTED